MSRPVGSAPCEEELVREEELAAGPPLSLPLGLIVEAIEIDLETFVVFRFPQARHGLSLLTEAEKIVVDLVLQGLTTTEIARARGVSKATVSSQLQSIYRKLHIGSRAELACMVG